MSRIKYALLGLALIAITGCGKARKENTEREPPAVVQQPATPQAPPVVTPESAPQIAVPELAKPAAEPQQPALAVRRPRKIRATQRPQVPENAVRKQAGATTAVNATGAPAEATTAPNAAGAQAEAPAPPSSAAPATASPIVEASAPPEVKEPEFATMPRGIIIQARLQEALDSGVNKTGDAFQAILDRDIEVNGRVVVPRGSILEGKFLNITRSGRVEGRATMSLQLVNVIVKKQSYPLQTEILDFEAESTRKQDATKVGIGAGIGAVIGAIAGGGKGAAIGAAVGAGAGGATVAVTRGKEVKFDREHVFNFLLSRDVSVKLE